MAKTEKNTPKVRKHEPEGFEGWAVVEVFGHQTYVGQVSEQAIGGCNFVRVDVPAVPATKHYPEAPAFTKLFGQAAIYSITPISEQAARQAAERLRTRPVTVYVPPARQIEGSREDDYGG